MKNVVYATRGVTTVVSATDGFTDLPLDYLTPSSTTSPLPDPFLYHLPTNFFFRYIIRSKVVQINFSKVVTRTRRSVRTHHRRGRDHGNGAIRAGSWKAEYWLGICSTEIFVPSNLMCPENFRVSPPSCFHLPKPKEKTCRATTVLCVLLKRKKTEKSRKRGPKG